MWERLIIETVLRQILLNARRWPQSYIVFIANKGKICSYNLNLSRVYNLLGILRELRSFYDFCLPLLVLKWVTQYGFAVFFIMYPHL